MRNVSSGENPASVQYRCNYWWEKWRLYDVFLIVFTLLYIGMIYKEILCLPLQHQAHIHYNTREDITKILLRTNFEQTPEKCRIEFY